MLRSFTIRLTPVIPPLLAACASNSVPPSPPRAPAAPAMTSPSATLVPAIAASLASFERGMDAIPAERKDGLDKLAGFVRTKRAAGETARLVFICTHNSRRSQMGQAWGSAVAAYYGIDGVETFSGGLEVTAFNRRAIAALERAGFPTTSPGGDNPHVKVTYATNRPPLEMFSKKYSDPFNPSGGFAAVMTCSHADASCPLVAGAASRVAIPYDDPKASDGTPEEAATYDARSRQLATELLYVFSHVKSDHAPVASRQ